MSPAAGKATIFVSEIPSPLGVIALAERRDEVVAITFRGLDALRDEHPDLWELGEVRPVKKSLSPGATLLGEYIRGKNPRFLSGALKKIKVDYSLVKGEFARNVLRELRRVPLGQTVSYGELAERVGSPGAARAVGSAMRRNPLAIVVPCHRVLPQNGALGNYTGGVDKKVWLLTHEGATYRT